MSHPIRKTSLFNFMAISNEKEAVSHLKWIADMVAENVKETPQTIVSCNTFNDTLTNLSYLLLVLKEKTFIDRVEREHLFLGLSITLSHANPESINRRRLQVRRFKELRVRQVVQ